MSTPRHEDNPVDQSLKALADLRPEPPALGDQLEAELASLKPVVTRRPKRQYALLGAVSVIYSLGLLAVLGLRDDLSGLPVLWLTLFAVAWLASFAVLGWFVLIPDRGQVMPHGRRGGIAAIIASLGFVAAGLMFDRHVPGVSIVREQTFGVLISTGYQCLLWGLTTAIVPLVWGQLLLRGSVPVSSRWVGAGLGAAGGCLGGFMLHLYCHVSDAMHVGFVHGGVVAVGAIIGAVVLPRTDVAV